MSTIDPLGLEPDTWQAPDEAIPAEPDVDELEPYAAPPPELLEWTPERAGAIVRGLGYGLHAADPLSSEPEAEALWKATEEDVTAIGPPLARILNRYEPARRLAGVSDEVELSLGMWQYAKRNLVVRGQAVAGRRRRAGEPEPGAPEWGPGAEPGGAVYPEL